MTNYFNIEQLIQTAINAAIEAGAAILKVYENEDFGVEFKQDNSPLTLADKNANEIILSYLKDTGLPILSEEGKSIPYETRKNWSEFWLVDPLDGTKEFIKRNHEFTVNIALIQDGKPVAGVVYVPVFKEIFWSDGQKSYKSRVEEDHSIDNNSTIELPLNMPRTNFVVVGSRSHMSEETKAFIHQLNTEDKPIEVISKGSSLKLCMVAEGMADVYPRLAPTMEWDTAAGHAIVLTAGKKVIDYSTKNEMVYNKENLLNPFFIVS